MIYNMDLFAGLKTLDDKSIDLVVTSPPYFDARNYGGEALFTNATDWSMFCFDAIVEMSEKLTDKGVIWWNTGSGYRDGRKMTEVYRLVIALEAAHIYLIDEIPWIKKSSPPKNIKNRPYPGWEHNFIFAPRPNKVVYYRDNVRRPYAPATLSRMKYKLGKLTPDMEGEYGEENKFVKPNPDGASSPNYLFLPQDTSRRPHPAPMIPELANWAIRAYSDVGDVVLDPMAGIGTTWIESEKLGRKFVGFEAVEDYVNIAKLSYARLQKGLDPYNGLKEDWLRKDA